jgi:peptide/nickel transport system substrate-binding protein
VCTGIVEETALSFFRKSAIRATAVGITAALALASCASERDEQPEGEGATGEAGKTFVFATSTDPVTLDPAFAADSDSYRVGHQIFEGLVGAKPGTPDPEPKLAESWDISEDGTEYTFHLQDGVKFHDGTDFNADAVCFNFERWNNFKGFLQSQNLTWVWIQVNGGFAESDDPTLDGTGRYKSCEATDESTAVVTLKEPMPEFIAALSSVSLFMQSPTALEKYNADEVKGDESAPIMPEYATEHPTGTGPFKFESWSRGQEVRLTANEDYWGEKGQIDEIVFPVIADPTARRQALQAGDIDGYDLVGPADRDALAEADFNVIDRPPFNILYLGINQDVPELKDIKVRQAIAHAVNKEALVSSTLPEGSEVAINFIPPSAPGWTEDVETYAYDPDKARQLLKEAGQENLELDFNYPTKVSRPYMPSPEQAFQAISADLKEVGIKINAKPQPWPDYLNTISGTSKHGIRLLGWTGEYNASYNFLGAFFNRPSKAWGFNNKELFSSLEDARFTSSEEEQIAAFEDVNRMISEFVPGVPLAHPVPSLAFAPHVDHYPASPVEDEVFNKITFKD